MPHLSTTAVTRPTAAPMASGASVVLTEPLLDLKFVRNSATAISEISKIGFDTCDTSVFFINACIWWILDLGVEVGGAVAELQDVLGQVLVHIAQAGIKVAHSVVRLHTWHAIFVDLPAPHLCLHVEVVRVVYHACAERQRQLALHVPAPVMTSPHHSTAAPDQAVDERRWDGDQHPLEQLRG